MRQIAFGGPFAVVASSHWRNVRIPFIERSRQKHLLSVGCVDCKLDDFGRRGFSGRLVLAHDSVPWVQEVECRAALLMFTAHGFFMSTEIFFYLAQCVHIRTSMRGYARWRPQACL